MLRLIVGPAGSGKTAAVVQEIARAVEEGRGGQILLVPEQYSHEAERELCRACGDSLSLYAEVFSFTGLARRVLAKEGGGALPLLDPGGRLLCMMLALEGVYTRLKVYGTARRRPELQEQLLAALDEIKTACVSPEALQAAALRCPGSLGDKLSDLALVAEAYEAVLAQGRADPADRLTRLAEKIPASDLGEGSHVYVDGFIDLTGQEHEVLRALLKKGASVTVCLTLDALDGDSEIFALSRLTARRLLAAAKELGQETEILTRQEQGGKADSLNFFTHHMFSYAAAPYSGEDCALRLVRADSMADECEFAAAHALRLVQEQGLRWREIAIAIRGFEDYRGLLESSFRHYGVPLYTARRSDLPAKPLPLLLRCAYEILEGGWDVDDVTDYLGTGLLDFSRPEADELMGYVFKWQLRAGAWERKGDWKQHPDGYGMEYDEAAKEKLGRINALRRRLAGPLLQLKERSEQAQTAREQAQALGTFLEELGLAQRLGERAELLRQRGQEEKAQEYRQLWELVVSALEQSAAVLGDLPMDRADFGRLFVRMLSKYDIGTIPVSLDRVSAGDFDRMRRRSIRELIVLGCSDGRLPMAEGTPGMFTEEERQRLLEAQIDLGGGEGELWREFSLIYNCLSLPSRGLSLCYAASGGQGEEQRPAFVYNRAKALFGLEEERSDREQNRLLAPAPALTLAATAVHGGSGAAQAAADYFRQQEPERFAALQAAADMSRGRLSPQGVEALYGRKLRLSASRIDKFSSCKFAYFCQYGLKAKPCEPAGFQPPEIGSFFHEVLENTAREVGELGGFQQVNEEQLRTITQKHIDGYVSRELNDFQEKSSRFVYLFRRLSRDVHQIVADMAGELRQSRFRPLDFELDFSQASELPPLELGDETESLRVGGVADRVDGWLHEGKLYLRVVDYKTGRKQFSMSDVWYGTGLQMLLYLLALQEGGQEKYGHEIVPAGVMYVPARSAILSVADDQDEADIRKKRDDSLRRSGLVLDEDCLIQAWEQGEEKRYIPLKYKYGKPDSNTIASLERMGLLFRHIKGYLREMAGQLRRGSIAADPYYRSQQENACLHCDYFAACHFTDGENGEHCRFQPKLSADKVWEIMEGGE